MAGIVEQDVLIRFDDPNVLIVEVSLKPVSVDQGLGMRVLRRVRTHEGKILSAARSPQVESGRSAPPHSFAATGL
jgi:hypothetical protein